MLRCVAWTTMISNVGSRLVMTHTFYNTTLYSGMKQCATLQTTTRMRQWRVNSKASNLLPSRVKKCLVNWKPEQTTTANVCVRMWLVDCVKMRSPPIGSSCWAKQTGWKRRRKSALLLMGFLLCALYLVFSVAFSSKMKYRNPLHYG